MRIIPSVFRISSMHLECVTRAKTYQGFKTASASANLLFRKRSRAAPHSFRAASRSIWGDLNEREMGVRLLNNNTCKSDPLFMNIRRDSIANNFHLRLSCYLRETLGHFSYFANILSGTTRVNLKMWEVHFDAEQIVRREVWGGVRQIITSVVNGLPWSLQSYFSPYTVKCMHSTLGPMSA